MVPGSWDGQGRGGANIHFLHRRPSPPGSVAVHFIFRIDNYPHILRAYGAEVARSALAEVNRIFADSIRDDGLVTPEPDGRLEVLLWNRTLLGQQPLAKACDNWIHSFCSAIAMVPLDCSGERLLLSVSGAWAGAELGKDDGPDALASSALHALERFRFSGGAPGHGEAWKEHYRADMEAAAGLFGAIEAEEAIDAFGSTEASIHFQPARSDSRQVALAWQPVRGVGGAIGILYHECLIRLIGSDGKSHPPGGLPEALERLGLVRALDHYVISAVIAELEQQPDVTLGVNISAQSTRFDGWWQDIAQRLTRNRPVAQRLVIEITETTPIPSITEATTFASRMRSLGCMIAIDDFGAGFASIRQLLALKPDIAKIDSFFVARAARSAQDRAAFMHLVGLADALVPLVVVEGIENDDQCQLALEAGALWQQGYHHGHPSLTRRWRWGIESAGLSGSLNELLANASVAGRSS